MFKPNAERCTLYCSEGLHATRYGRQVIIYLTVSHGVIYYIKNWTKYSNIILNVGAHDILSFHFYKKTLNLAL